MDFTLQPMQDPTLQQGDMPQRKLLPTESSHWSIFLAGTAAPGGPTLEQFVKDCIPWEDLHAGAGVSGGKKCEERAAETKCQEPGKHNPFPTALMPE